MKLLNFLRREQPIKHIEPRLRLGRRFMHPAAGENWLESWVTVPTTIEEFVGKNQRQLIARSREQYWTNSFYRHFVRLLLSNILGARGVMMQSQANNDLAKAVESNWREWGKRGQCDMTRQLDWLTLQKQAVTAVATDGECFIWLHQVGDSLRAQVLDALAVPVEYQQAKRNGLKVSGGIEYDDANCPTRYFIRRNREIINEAGGVEPLIAVPAAQMVHVYLPEQVGQKRGLPWGSVSLMRSKMLGGFEESTLLNAKANASKFAFLKSQDGIGEDDKDIDYVLDAYGVRMETLPTGYDLADWQSKFPEESFGHFVKWMLRGVSAGVGISYHNLANDLEGVNYSSIRQGTLEEREIWQQLQEWFIGNLHEQIFKQWLPLELLSGRLRVRGQPVSAARLGECQRVRWAPRRWQWVDPKSDSVAALNFVRAGLKSPSDVIREQGRDPDEVWQEFGSDIERMKQAGISETMIDKFFELKGAKADEQEDRKNTDG